MPKSLAERLAELDDPAPQGQMLFEPKGWVLVNVLNAT